MRSLSLWMKTWIVVAVLVAAFSSFALWAIYDFGQAYNGVAAKWDRPTSLSAMVGITMLGLFIGSVVFAAALTGRYLWRLIRGKSRN